MDRVVVQPIDKDKFRVYEDYHYWGICVPKGFTTNGADIPRILWSLFPPNSPESLSAVVIHDYMCAKIGVFTYKEADEMFYEAMIEIGVSKWKAKLFYKSCSIYHTVKSFLNKEL